MQVIPARVVKPAVGGNSKSRSNKGSKKKSHSPQQPQQQQPRKTPAAPSTPARPSSLMAKSINRQRRRQRQSNVRFENHPIVMGDSVCEEKVKPTADDPGHSHSACWPGTPSSRGTSSTQSTTASCDDTTPSRRRTRFIVFRTHKRQPHVVQKLFCRKFHPEDNHDSQQESHIQQQRMPPGSLPRLSSTTSSSSQQIDPEVLQRGNRLLTALGNGTYFPRKHVPSRVRADDDRSCDDSSEPTRPYQVPYHQQQRQQQQQHRKMNDKNEKARRPRSPIVSLFGRKTPTSPTSPTTTTTPPPPSIRIGRQFVSTLSFSRSDDDDDEHTNAAETVDSLARVRQALAQDFRGQSRDEIRASLVRIAADLDVENNNNKHNKSNEDALNTSHDNSSTVLPLIPAPVGRGLQGLWGWGGGGDTAKSNKNDKDDDDDESSGSFSHWMAMVDYDNSYDDEDEDFEDEFTEMTSVKDNSTIFGVGLGTFLFGKKGARRPATPDLSDAGWFGGGGGGGAVAGGGNAASDEDDHNHGWFPAMVLPTPKTITTKTKSTSERKSKKAATASKQKSSATSSKPANNNSNNNNGNGNGFPVSLFGSPREEQQNQKQPPNNKGDNDKGVGGFFFGRTSSGIVEEKKEESKDEGLGGGALGEIGDFLFGTGPELKNFRPVDRSESPPMPRGRRSRSPAIRTIPREHEPRASSQKPTSRKTTEKEQPKRRSHSLRPSARHNKPNSPRFSSRAISPPPQKATARSRLSPIARKEQAKDPPASPKLGRASRYRQDTVPVHEQQQYSPERRRQTKSPAPSGTSKRRNGRGGRNTAMPSLRNDRDDLSDDLDLSEEEVERIRTKSFDRVAQPRQGYIAKNFSLSGNRRLNSKDGNFSVDSIDSSQFRASRPMHHVIRSEVGHAVGLGGSRRYPSLLDAYDEEDDQSDVSSMNPQWGYYDSRRFIS